jgi:ubiquinone biosynthesis protein
MIDIRQLRNIPRIKDITTILVKHGLEQMAETLGLASLFEKARRIVTKESETELALTLPQRLRSVMQELGPTFIKLGQILSTRRDLLSEEYIEEFSKLQDSVPPMEYDRVEQVFLRELGKIPTQVFARFEREPLAAASIGQVHRATCHDGREVVVKVQRDEIAGAIRSDVEILYFLARKLEQAELVDRTYSPTEIVEEFSRSIRQELDYLREAQNMHTFRANFASDPKVHIPQVHGDLTTSRLLCMEFIHGKKAAKFQEADCDPAQIARTGALTVLKQIFQDGCFHADPHPGNILIMPGNVVCLMDFGMTGRLSVKMRDHLSWLLIHLINRDYDALARALIDAAEPMEDVDVDALATSLLDTLDPYYGASLRHIDLGGLIRSCSRLLVRYRLKLPTGYTLMLKSLVTVEGLGKKLDPDFDLTALARPFVEQLVVDRWKPKRLAHDLELLALDMTSFIRRTPHQVAKILARLQHGTLDLQFTHKGLNPMMGTLDKVSNRISFSLVIAALVLSSSVIMASQMGSAGGPITWLGVAGYVAAALLGLWLAFSILRSGGL